MKNLIKYCSTILVILVCFSNISYGQSVSCDAELSFVNDIANKKAGLSGTYYRMKLTNKGDSNDFFISVNKIGKSKNFKSIANEELNYLVTDSYKKELQLNIGSDSKSKNNKDYKVSLNRNESVTFYVRVKNPNRAKIGLKKEISLVVKSNNCDSFKLSQTLRTEIINGE